MEILQKKTINKKKLQIIEKLASQVQDILNNKAIKAQIKTVHKLHGTSMQIEKILQPELEKLGFECNKKKLFANYESALRPDFFVSFENCGVILEVERGRTLANNMDILDFWKCHICKDADFLFLIVPEIRVSKSGRAKMYSTVIKRLGSFFEDSAYTNVEAAVIFKY